MPGEKRQDERVPVGLRVRLRFANIDEFVAGYAANLSRSGVFLDGVPAKPADTKVRFELLLADGSAALRGEGRVMWSRATGARAGVAIRFTVLDGRSKQLLDELFRNDRILPGSLPPPAPSILPVAIEPEKRVEPIKPLAVSLHAPPPPPTPPPATRPRLDETSEMPVAVPRIVASAVPSMPMPVSSSSRRNSIAPSRSAADLLAFDTELQALGTHVRMLTAPERSTARRSIDDLDRELSKLSEEFAIKPTARIRMSVPAPHRSVPPAPGDYSDLPMVFSLLDDGGLVRSVIGTRMPPAPSDEVGDSDTDEFGGLAVDKSRALPIASAPAMREPTPVPTAPDGDEIRDETIPPPSKLGLKLDDHDTILMSLPDLELEDISADDLEDVSDDADPDEAPAITTEASRSGKPGVRAR